MHDVVMDTDTYKHPHRGSKSQLTDHKYYGIVGNTTNPKGTKQINSVVQWINCANEHQIDLLGKVSKLRTTLVQAKLPCFLRSIQQTQSCTFILIHIQNLRDRYLLVISNTQAAIDALGLTGKDLSQAKSHQNKNSPYLLAAETNSQNAKTLRRLFPFTAPSAIQDPSFLPIDNSKNAYPSPPKKKPEQKPELKPQLSFGVGDRLGIASYGHLALFENYDIVPVLAQQSKRELMLSARTYSDIVDEASWDVFAANYQKPWLADGDHLKSPEQIIDALERGCTMITADLSDQIYANYLKCELEELNLAYSALDTNYTLYIEKAYRSKHIELANNHSLTFTQTDIQRIVLTYAKAIDLARALYETVNQYQDAHAKKIYFEISIDETDLPTSAQAHFFVSQELMNSHVPFHSLAPRFCGEFQKGIDYIGDLGEFRKDLEIHHAIVKYYYDQGYPYKLSIHSGSDKFSVFPHIGQELGKNFHIKTSGTNWLIALLTIAEIDPELFRMIYHKAYEVFETAKEYYKISPDFKSKTDILTIPDEKLSTVLNNNCDRQVLHIAYGELFKITGLKTRIDALLHSELTIYWKHLNAHIQAHLDKLL